MALVLATPRTATHPVARSFAVWLVGVAADQWNTWRERLAAARRPREPRTAEELFEWAQQYEATQPSYAEDLRAAALRAMADRPAA